MAFDYQEMRNAAYDLLSDNMFGTPCVLRKPDEEVYDEEQMKTVRTFKEYKGTAVRKIYAADQIGESGTLIMAGDADFYLVMNNEKIIPTENVDKIRYEGIEYNVLHVSEVNPNGKKIIVHKCHSRRVK